MECCWNCRNLVFLSYLFGKETIYEKCEICGRVLDGDIETYVVIFKL